MEGTGSGRRAVARRKRVPLSAERWSRDAASVWTRMADWRAAHPKATFGEIEAALDERLNQVRARVLADLALASAAAEVAGASGEERSGCRRWGTGLHAPGGGDRKPVAPGRAAVIGRASRGVKVVSTLG